MLKRRLKIFFDGGCRPNPGAMEIAAVVRGVTYHESDIGYGSNNDAEWLALIHGLKLALSLGETKIELVGDSLMVVNQANKVWKCRSADLRKHLAAFEKLASQFEHLRIRHIGRNQNLAGIALARLHPDF